MKVEKMSIELLNYKIAKSKAFISDLKKTLECIPEYSILGRLSITMSLAVEEKRLEKLEMELKKRA